MPSQITCHQRRCMIARSECVHVNILRKHLSGIATKRAEPKLESQRFVIKRDLKLVSWKIFFKALTN
jgi:hypothetical protein